MKTAITHADLSLLCRHLVERCGHDAHDLLRVIEKPHHWMEELEEARAWLDSEETEMEHDAHMGCDA